MKRIFASYYDSFMHLFEQKLILGWRRDLLMHAKGTVLEIGAGTGVNFPIYENCKEVVAVEPNQFMIQKAMKRQKQANVPITIIEKRAEELPFPDKSFDTIVLTLVLCSVQDPSQVIVELKRVLKPGGKILLLEHVKMNHPIYSVVQTLFTPVWKRICDGCHLNRQTENTIHHFDLEVQEKKEFLRGFAIAMILAKR
jgi:ubiquinone/menaquinone biosynthesis C-methylase UbiE